ncbi:SAC3 family protein B isoform X3 [Nymphaea colorata]|uniref:SAC3 family protein B isoform X3 n=1 Tax=Nymphaea colorata TaxID=210225 RepID=UPI00129D806F|nr:SAC3 family protein B isoform X3 [Nymphaea colorata]
MALDGFGRNSGPSAPPKSPTLFGNNPQPSKPSPQFGSGAAHKLQHPNPPSDAWNSKTVSLPTVTDFPVSTRMIMKGDPLPYGHDAYATSTDFTQDKNERYHESSRFPLNHSGPIAYIKSNPQPDGWNARHVSPPKVLDFQASPGPMPSTLPHLQGVSASKRKFTEEKSNRYPPNAASDVPKRTTSPVPHIDELSRSNFPFVQFGTEKSGAPLARSSFSPNSPTNVASLPQQQASNPRFDGQSGGTRSPPKAPSFQVPKSTRSPPLAYTDEILAPDLRKMKDGTERSPPKRSSFQVPKRTRSPPVAYTDEILAPDLHTMQAESEREAQAKAKRLARFNVELKQPISNLEHFHKHNPAGDRSDQRVHGIKKFVPEVSVDGPTYTAKGSPLADSDAMDTASIWNSESNGTIVGLCPDMCPESEREERERKGDLDRCERMDGERNQTNKWLAVKKYNRTAEREAQLIRPLPVLQKTVNYLLNLINQPYDDKFLNIYNFLWDRMRAIRMDLRMQHIFNSDAITMHEQMIRLHIIAMHEFCEYSKGEGFSEGFDAHLNIEQMNKTSVELFQMYDDHRKKGVVFPTEREFRGYYALLKLDKHPGYKVEPAELSHDLAKMTPEMRKTPEVLFARDVARACRSGNFIAFFRHARKATYLQACLMHAHFGKLRSHGLASLHSGLQNNQGIPVDHIVKWLAMEEEDVESLLEYHGFSIKKYEDAYMVKEGPFLNSDKDFSVKCSRLVHLKKSAAIFDDVFSNKLLLSSSKPEVTVSSYEADYKPREYSKLPWLNHTEDDMVECENKADHTDDQQVSLHVPSEGPLLTSPKSMSSSSLTSFMSRGLHQSTMPLGAPSPTRPKNRDRDRVSLQFGGPSPTSPKNKDAHQMSFPLPGQLSTTSNNRDNQQISLLGELPSTSPKKRGSYQVSFPLGRSLSSSKVQNDNHVSAFGLASNENVVNYQHISTSNGVEGIFFDSDMDQSPENESTENIRNEEDQEASISHDDVLEESLKLQKELFEQEELMKERIEAAKAKLRVFLRLWKRRSSKRKELRELQRLMSSAALNSLSLGPPILQNKLPLHPSVELKLDNIVKERKQRWRKSWSRVNVSEVVLQLLHQKNLQSKCICWKLVLSIRTKQIEQHFSASHEQYNQLVGSWLVSKLMCCENDTEDEMIVSTSDLSIWKEWARLQSNSQQVCCLSVLREVFFDPEKPISTADTLLGVSGVLFLVSESRQWDLDRLRLHNLIASLPSGSNLPLLILTVGMDEKINLSSLMSDNLELSSLDKTKIRGFSVVNLSEDGGLYSDEHLKEGLRWLADQSPVQPVLQQVKTRELVVEYLNVSMEQLETMKPSEVTPDQCINALNNALEKSASDIILAVQGNPTNWPGPEIGLIDEFTVEARAVGFELPKVGWSSPAAVEHVLNSLSSCKLPEFPNSFSWVNKDSEIQNQKLALESNLKWYLTEACGMMQGDLAAREVCLMVQRGATLDFDGTRCQIVPKWVVIFRRIFNWRLMNLSSVAYVLKRRHRASPDKYSWSRQRLVAEPSLDEMIEISCRVPTRQCQHPERATEDGEFRNRSLQGDERCLVHEMEQNDGMEIQQKRELAVESRESKLNSLLERCTVVQNMIDEKLSFYF